MSWTSCLAAAVALLLPAQPAPATPPAALENVRPVTVPSFESERGHRWSSTREEDETARADAAFAFEQFTYTSDGLTVGAYLYRPRQRGEALPVIVYNRGSFTRPDGFAGEMLVMANRYARAGFIVVAPHYRGSNGWKRARRAGRRRARRPDEHRPAARPHRRGRSLARLPRG